MFLDRGGKVSAWKDKDGDWVETGHLEEKHQKMKYWLMACHELVTRGYNGKCVGYRPQNKEWTGLDEVVNWMNDKCKQLTALAFTFPALLQEWHDVVWFETSTGCTF